MRGLWLLTMLALVIIAAITAIYYTYRFALLQKHALTLSRLDQSKKVSNDIYLGYTKARLSQWVIVQNMLADLPGCQILAQKLETSGLPYSVDLLLLLSISLLGFGVALLQQMHVLLMLCLFVGLLLMLLPWFYVQWCCNVRIAKCESQLTGALDAMVLYLRSGKSLPQAFVSAIDATPQPLATELARCAEYYRLGRPFAYTLSQLADRFAGSVGFRMLATAVSIVAQTGGNMVEIFERIRHMLEESERYRLKLMAATGEARNSAMILSIAPGAFLVFAAFRSPTTFNVFFEVLAGQIAFGLFVALWLIGVIWVRYLIS